jgi:membrane protein YdbS with pleckstrin-like domain
MAQRGLRLQPGEEILVDMVPSAFWTSPKYVYTLGLWAVWRKRHRFIVTNRRVVVTTGILAYTERALPLAKIQDVTLHRSVNSGGRVSLSSAGGVLGVEEIGPLSRAKASAFADALGPLIHPPSEDTPDLRPSPAASTNIASELERLADLRERGALTDDEFNSQKLKLLSR